MNIRLSTVIGIAVLSALNGIHGQSKTAKLSPENFSDYQGAMNWEEARKKCSSIGMKLPSIDELKAAFEAKITESWTNDGYYVYWSSTLNGKNGANTIRAEYGTVFSDNRNGRYNVRCIRDGSKKNIETAKSEVKKNAPLGKFSDYQGAMPWTEAGEKCASLGMRLPTIEELKAAKAAKTADSWTADANTYWSSTPNDDGNADTLDVYNNDASNMRRAYSAHVRCIK